MLLLWTFCWCHASLLVNVVGGGRGFLMSICVVTVTEAPFHLRRDEATECLWISFASECIYIYSFCLFLCRPAHGEGTARVQYRPGYGQRGGWCAVVVRGEGQPPTRTKRSHVVPRGKFQLLFMGINNFSPLTVVMCARLWLTTNRIVCVCVWKYIMTPPIDTSVCQKSLHLTTHLKVQACLSRFK